MFTAVVFDELNNLFYSYDIHLNDESWTPDDLRKDLEDKLVAGYELLYFRQEFAL